MCYEGLEAVFHEHHINLWDHVFVWLLFRNMQIWNPGNRTYSCRKVFVCDVNMCYHSKVVLCGFEMCSVYNIRDSSKKALNCSSEVFGIVKQTCNSEHTLAQYRLLGNKYPKLRQISRKCARVSDFSPENRVYLHFFVFPLFRNFPRHLEFLEGCRDVDAKLHSNVALGLFPCRQC